MAFIRSIVQSVSVAACLAVVVSPSAAHATSFNGWDYAIGSFNNGVDEYGIGGNEFEFYGLAIRDSGSKMQVALNTNLPLAGKAGITYGDLFFNFTGTPLKAASEVRQLFGVHFAQENSESGAPSVGIYSNVIAKSVTQANKGFSNLSVRDTFVNYYSQLPAEQKQELNSLGDIKTTDAYFEGQRTGTETVLNSIGSGTKVGELALLTADLLTSDGLDFARFGATGRQTIGFSFEKPADFGGDYIASIFAECANDGLALVGVEKTAEAAPEPTTIAGLALAGSGLAALKRWQKQQKS